MSEKFEELIDQIDRRLERIEGYILSNSSSEKIYRTATWGDMYKMLQKVEFSKSNLETFEQLILVSLGRFILRTNEDRNRLYIDTNPGGIPTYERYLYFNTSYEKVIVRKNFEGSMGDESVADWIIPFECAIHDQLCAEVYNLMKESFKDS